MTYLTKTDIFDLLADHLAVFEADMTTGVISWASRSLERTFGYTLAGELEGESVEILLPTALRERHAKEHRPAYAANPEPRLMGRRLELTGQRKDGTILPVEVMLLPRVVNKHRVVVGIVFSMESRT